MTRAVKAAVLNGCAFFLMTGVGATVTRLPGKVMALSGSFMEVGLLASAFALPFVLFQLPLGWLADRYGFRRFLAAGYACCAIAGILYASAQTPSLILAGRVLQGLGEAPVWALAPVMLAALHGDGKGAATGAYNASIHMGLTGGALLGGFMGNAWNGDAGFYLLFSGGGCGALMAGWRSEAPRTFIRPSPLENRGGLVKDRGIRGVLTGIALYGCGYGLFLTLIPAAVIPDPGSGAFSVSLFFVLFYIAVGLSQILGGRLTDKIGKWQTMVLGLLLATTGMFLTSTGLSWEYAFLSMAAFGLGIFSVASMVFLMAHLPGPMQGRASTLFYLFWGIGFFAGPMLLGKVADGSHIATGLWLFTLLLGFETVWLGIACSHGRMGRPLLREKKKEAA